MKAVYTEVGGRGPNGSQQHPVIKHHKRVGLVGERGVVLGLVWSQGGCRHLGSGS